MTIDHLCKFISKCCYENCSPKDSIVLSIQEQIDKKKQGFITLDQFLDFYEESSVTKPHTVWKNMESFGYRHDLKKFTDPTEIKVDIQQLPREIIMKNSEYYKILFNIIDLNKDTGSMTWQLL